jgi:hypothetical protein
MSFIFAQLAGCNLSRFVRAEYLCFELILEVCIVCIIPKWQAFKLLTVNYFSRNHPVLTPI